MNSFVPLHVISLLSRAKTNGVLLLFAVLTLCTVQLTRADPAGTLVNPRWFHTATLLADGRVLLAGGVIQNGATDSCEIYNPATNAWTKTGSLNGARWFHSAVLLTDGRVLAA